jgi:hypothetical protein
MLIAHYEFSSRGSMALADLSRGVVFLRGALGVEGCLAKAIRIRNNCRRVVYGTGKRPLIPWTRLSLTRRELICACEGRSRDAMAVSNYPFLQVGSAGGDGPIAALVINVFLRPPLYVSIAEVGDVPPNPERSWRT